MSVTNWLLDLMKEYGIGQPKPSFPQSTPLGHGVPEPGWMPGYATADTLEHLRQMRNATTMPSRAPVPEMPAMEPMLPRNTPAPLAQQPEIGVMHPRMGIDPTAADVRPLGPAPSPMGRSTAELPASWFRGSISPETEMISQEEKANALLEYESSPQYAERQSMDSLMQRNALARLRIANRRGGRPRHEGLFDRPNTAISQQLATMGGAKPLSPAMESIFAERAKTPAQLDWLRFKARAQKDHPLAPTMVWSPPIKPAEVAQVDPADIQRGLAALAAARTKRMLYSAREGHTTSPAFSTEWNPGDQFTSDSVAPVSSLGDMPVDSGGETAAFALPHLTTTGNADGPARALADRGDDPELEARQARVVQNAMARRQARQYSKANIHPMMANPWAMMSAGNPQTMLAMLELQQKSQSDMASNRLGYYNANVNRMRTRDLGSYYGNMNRIAQSDLDMKRKQSEWAMSPEGMEFTRETQGIARRDANPMMPAYELLFKQAVIDEDWTKAFRIGTQILGRDPTEMQDYIRETGGIEAIESLRKGGQRSNTAFQTGVTWGK